MEDIFSGLYVLIQQLVRLLQLVGLPVFTVLFIIGLLFLLTAGKNPIRKRRGYIFAIIFGVGALLIAYLPVITHMFGNSTPTVVDKNDDIVGMVDSAAILGPNLFKGVWYVSVPVVFTMFYMGMLMRSVAGKNPQRKRLGLGMMIFSPIVLGLAYAVPILTKML